MSGVTRDVEKEEEGRRRNQWNTNKEKWKRKKKREVRARDAILEGRAQRRTAVKATVKIADGPRSLGLAPVLWSVEPAGVLASASSGLHDPVVQLAGCAVSCRDSPGLRLPVSHANGARARVSWDVPGVPAGTNPILQKTNNARVRHSACGAHFYINGDFGIDGRGERRSGDIANDLPRKRPAVAGEM
ncbi:hypothetical protein HPB52_007363 [Rhipicephalus sanguineus]|uniref:Uncharacterized protein n=1 Tax=Rhipicephalus sanguineus TaxID=34632 RepID=A0A9D4QI49_RHISA|nr:hypothetical protein HPB52_007363 [Rhipicephalus sanguineus]